MVHLAPTSNRGTTAPPAPTASAAAVTSLNVVSTVAVPASSPLPADKPTVANVRVAPSADKASVVIARAVHGETPLMQSTRFLSPALRLYAVATVHNVKATDSLRFVFQRNGETLLHDDITIAASTTMGSHAFLAVHSFKAFADYQHGSKPLPTGNYKVLFYKSGQLEGETSFRVG
jgi:hypothetical protein